MLRLTLAARIARRVRCAHPGSAPASDRRDQRQAAPKPPRSRRRYAENGRKLDALNEKINDAQVVLDAANQAIVQADADVAAAQAKTDGDPCRGRVAPADIYMSAARRAVAALGARHDEGTRPHVAAEVHRRRRSARQAPARRSAALEGAAGREEGRATTARAGGRSAEGADRVREGRRAGRRREATRAPRPGEQQHRRSRRAGRSRGARRRKPPPRPSDSGSNRRRPRNSSSSSRRRRRRRRAPRSARCSRTRTRSSGSRTATPVSGPSATTARG